MKCLKLILFIFTLSFTLSAQIDTNSQHYYAFIYFVQGEVEQTLGARLALSTDAVSWQKYNDEKPVIVPKISNVDIPLMRDPNILYDSTTGVFHLIWTTQWVDNIVGYATSKDLVNWSDQVKVPVGQQISGCKCCWAPEFIQVKDSVMLYWSTDRGICGKEPFYSMTTDFKHYTPPKPFFSPKTEDGKGYSIIDDNLIKIADNKYYLFIKDERKSGDVGKQCQNIHFVFGPSPLGPWWKGPWDDVSEPITLPGFEGPTSIIIGDELRMYSDPFMSHTNTDRTRVIKLAALMSDSAPPATAWTKGPVMKTITPPGPFLPSHGSIFEIPRVKFMHILYNTPDSTKYSCGWKDLKNEDISFVNVLPARECLSQNIEPIKPPDKVYPMGKQNMGCGTGVGLALIPPIVIRGRSLYRRRKQKVKTK